MSEAGPGYADVPAAKAMIDVMGDVRELAKLERNPQFNFMFRGVDAVMNAVGPALRKHGIVVGSKILSIHIDSYHTSKETVMNRAIVGVRYDFTAVDGSSVSGEAYGEASDTMDKSVPKAMSVAYRTVILQMLCLPTHEADPDAGGEPGDERADPPQPSPLSQALAYLRSVVDANNLDAELVPEQFYRRYNVGIGQATVEQVKEYTLYVQTTKEL